MAPTQRRAAASSALHQIRTPMTTKRGALQQGGDSADRCIAATTARVYSGYYSVVEETMADDRMKRGPADRSRINIHEPYEVRYWCRELQVPSDRLRSAVKKVGP